MKEGFLDEAGDVNPFGGSRFLVVAVLVVEQPKMVERHLKRIYQKLARKPTSGEMKATQSEERVVKQLLQFITKEEISIVTVIVNKRDMVKPLAKTEEMYRWAVGQVVRHGVKQWPRLLIHLDKRYTTKTLQIQLEQQIREMLTNIYQEVVLIRQEDSHSQKGLQVVDYVVWAIFQKYERNNEQFYQIIADKILVEELLTPPF
jgi:hypothetical protein